MTTDPPVSSRPVRTADEREREAIEGLAAIARNPELSRRFLAAMDDGPAPDQPGDSSPSEPAATRER